MQYTYVGMDARQFTYQFLGELSQVRHICRVTWKAVNWCVIAEGRRNGNNESGAIPFLQEILPAGGQFIKDSGDGIGHGE